MAYVPFTNDYSTPRTPAFAAAAYAKRVADQSRVNDIFQSGNAVLGALVADCCSDPAYGGQGFYDDSNGAFGTPGATASDPMAVLPVPGSYPLTPPDILSRSYGFPTRADGRPFARPRLPGRVRQRWIDAFPNHGPGVEASRLVPPCPCFSSAAPIPITVPKIITPAPAPAAAPAAPAPTCPYPACSTGNVCLDLITGCVSNSQVDPAQTQACALANYPIFGDSGAWLTPILLGCGTNLPKLGTPLPNPPQADPSMYPKLNAAIVAGGLATSKARGVSGLGDVSTGPSNAGGFLAILGLFGIVVWATRK